MMRSKYHVLRGQFMCLFIYFVLLAFVFTGVSCSTKSNLAPTNTPVDIMLEQPSPMAQSTSLSATAPPTVADSETVLGTITPTSTKKVTPTLSEMEILPKVTATFTSSNTKIPLSTPIATVIRPVFSELPQHHLLGITTGHLWHPDTELFTEQLPIRMASWSPSGNEIVGWDTQNDTLAILNLTTSSVFPLLETRAWYSFPLWSPDSQFLLYTIPSDGSESIDHDQIAVYELGRQEIIYLSPQVNLAGGIGWSSDSSKFSYLAWVRDQADSDPKLTLFVVDFVNENVFDYSFDDIGVSTVAWSPNKNEILLYANNVHPDDTPLTTYSYLGLYLLEIESGVVQLLKLSESPIGESRFDDGPGLYAGLHPWSPDGERLIYSDRGRICILNVGDRSEQCPASIDQTISEVGAVGAIYPAWSPDESWISFSIVFEDSLCNALAVIRPDGSDLRFSDVSRHDCASFGAIWSSEK